MIDIEDFLKKEKIRKKNAQKYIPEYIWRRQAKTNKAYEKSNSWYIPKTVRTTNRTSNREN